MYHKYQNSWNTFGEPNPEQSTDPTVPKITHCQVSRKTTDGEIMVKQHVFDYIISGAVKVFYEGKTQYFAAGDFCFAARNRLCRFIKVPPAGGEYRAISICIDQDTLHEIQQLYKENGKMNKQYDSVLLLKSNQAFRNYVDSLLPYVESGNTISEQLVRIKIREAVLIFLEANPELRHILFDFSEPGKIDLEAYRNEHYSFTGELKEFAYLTGRSLSTYKRDFRKTFQTTPCKWLMKKRLEVAFFLIKVRRMRPNEASIEVGFKDYSHFSFVFKKAFGVAPSQTW